MTFLNPLLLFGLAAAAIPLIIHLFNFRRPRRVDFSSLAFLREVQRSTMQRVRIKQWLLLLLRTLAIAALVLAFARPTLEGGLPGGFGGRAPASVALVIDDSPSMTLRDAQGAYFDQALDAARAIAGATDARDEVFLLTTSGREARPVVAQPGGSATADRLGELTQADGTGTLAAAMGRAVALLGSAAQPVRELYVVSDLQASTFTDSTDTVGPTDARVRMIPVGTRTEANIAVTDVRIVSRIIEPGQPVRLEADLENFGPSTAAGYSASVYLGEERVAQASADLPPGVRTTLSFVLTPRERGWLAGRVETEDDVFSADNVHWFTLAVPEERSLLVVEGAGRTAAYLRTVFSSELTGDRVRFAVRSIPESALPATELAAFDVVLLGGPVDLSDGEIDRIARFVEGGGGVLWFPGDGARMDDYNALLSTLGAGRVDGVAAGAGSEPVDVVEGMDLEHPLFQGVLQGGGRSPERPTLYRRMNYRPGRGTENTIIGLAGGLPFLQEIRRGRGAVLLMTAAVDPAWSDLPTRGLFVPLMYRSVYLLSSAGAVAGESFRVGEAAELLLPGPVSERVDVTGPSGEAVTPDRRDGVGGTLLRLDGLLDDPGVYDVRAGGRLVRRIAANPDPRESDLNRLESDEAADRLASRFGLDVAVLRLESGDVAAAQATVSAARQGIELWNVFMGLALLFLLAEMVVARSWRPESAT